MNILRVFALLLASGAMELRAQDFLDRLDEHLTIAAFNDTVRARLSGTIDLEYYHFQQPAPWTSRRIGQRSLQSAAYRVFRRADRVARLLFRTGAV